MEINGYTTLSKTVKSAQVDLYGSGLDRGRYFQMLKWARDCYIDLRLHLLPQNIPVELPVINNPYSVKIPGDYMNFIAIGRERDGRFEPFDEDRGVIKVMKEACGSGIDYADRPSSYWYRYTLDEQHDRILLGGIPTLTTVILLYVSTGVKIGEQTVIPRKVEPVIRAWIHYQRELFDPTKGGMFQVMEQRYTNELRKLQKFNFNMDAMYWILDEVKMENS